MERGEHVERHRDGSLRARGPTLDGQPDGYWEWFRRDGTKLRSGRFARGEQTGEWTTYDARGEVYKVTTPGGRGGAGARASVHGSPSPGSEDGEPGRAPSVPGPEVTADTPLDTPGLALPRPAVAGLKAAGLTTFGQVWAADDRDLLALHGVGPKGVRAIRGFARPG